MKQDRAVLEIINTINIIDNPDAFKTLLVTLSTPKQQTVTIGFMNAHALNLCYRDEDFLKNLSQCDHILRDGIGMKILFKLLGRNPGFNMNGTDFIPMLLNKFKHRAIALYGTKKKYLDASAQKIEGMGLTVVSTQDGFQSDNIYMDDAVNNHAELIVLAMGMPKQERLAVAMATKINSPTTIICGGAILDFMGGKVTRAPKIYRACGMEWFYRLTQEPRRLFVRYCIGNFIMFYHAIRLGILMKQQKRRAA